MFSTSETSQVNSQSKPAPVPSRSMEVSRISPAPRSSASLRPGDSIAASRLSSSADVHFEFCFSVTALRVNRDDHGLRAVALCDTRDQCRIGQRGRIDADFVSSCIEHCRRIVQRSDATTDRERYKQPSRGPAHGFGESRTFLLGRRNIKQDHFIGSGGAMRRGQLSRIAGIAQVLKLHAFHDAPGCDVEACDDSLGQHESLQKFSRIFSPIAPDFSGWNCTPNKFSCSIPAENSPPYSLRATVAFTTGAR